MFLSFDKMRHCATDEEFASRVKAFCTKSDKPSKRLRARTHIEKEKQHRVTRIQTSYPPKQADATDDGSRLEVDLLVYLLEWFSQLQFGEPTVSIVQLCKK